METKLLSRSHLETLSSADLIALADDYGIDVPDDLNRRFIIGELLEVAEELSQDREVEEMKEEKLPENLDGSLPETFNETQITVIMRNPVWAYVYWDIRESDLAKLLPSNNFMSLVLRVTFLDSPDSTTTVETFDVQVNEKDRAQYVLLPAGKKFVRIDLVVIARGKDDEILSISKIIALPQGSDLLTDGLPGRDLDVPELMKLSSLDDVLRSHYENHRQSFL